MAAFSSKRPEDWLAFRAKWEAMLSNPAIELRTIVIDGEVCGYIGHFLQLGRPSISYWLGHEYWKRGIATTAIARFLKTIATRPLYARVAIDNVASLRALIKNGFDEIGRESRTADMRGGEIEEVLLELKG